MLFPSYRSFSHPRAPLPETLIAGNPKFYFEFLFRAWAPDALSSIATEEDEELKTTASKALPEWVRDGVQPYLDPELGYARIVAACEDVRRLSFILL